MRNLFVWGGQRPVAALALAAALTAVFSAGLPDLGVNASVEQALSPSDPRVGQWREVRENFSSRPLVLATARVPELFSERSLSLLRAYGDALASVEGVERGVGLFDAPGFDPERGGMPMAGPAVLAKPGLEEETVREAILGEPLYRGVFVDRSGSTALFYLSLELERDGGRNHLETLDRLEALRGEFLETMPEGTRLGFVGVPVALAATQRYTIWDLTRLGPAALAVVVAVVLLFFRCAAAVVLPLVTGVLSVSATLGFMGFAGYEISPYLSTVVVLVLVLGCTEDLHILSGYLAARDEGRSAKKALARVGSSQGVALLLTSGTTVLSFASIAFSDIVGLRNFALTCSFAMAVNFAITVLAAPALLTIFAPKPGEGRGRSLGRLEALLRGWLSGKPRALTLLLAALFALCLGGATRVEIDTDFRRLFKEDSELARGIREFAESFGGDTAAVLTFETHRRHGALEPEALDDLRLLHRFVEEGQGYALGHLSLFDAYRRAKHGGREEGPPPGSEAEDLASFAAIAPSEMLAPFLDFDGSRAAISLVVDAPGSSDLLAFEERLLARAGEGVDPAREVVLTGDAVLLAHVCDEVARQLLLSLLGLTLVVAALIALLFRSLALGLVAIVPNLFPIAATFGAMGWLGMPLGLGTFPVAIVAFGIAVDDTIHFIASFREWRRRGRAPEAAALSALGKELRPVLATSLMITSGYLVLLLSPFRLTSEYGFLFSLACISALLADLLLTPLLLARFEGRSWWRASGRAGGRETGC